MVEECFALCKPDILEQIHFGHQQVVYAACHFYQQYWHDIVIQHMMVVLFEKKRKSNEIKKNTSKRFDQKIRTDRWI